MVVGHSNTALLWTLDHGTVSMRLGMRLHRVDFTLLVECRIISMRHWGSGRVHAPLREGIVLLAAETLF